MVGTLVNTVAVLSGGMIGLLLKKKMPQRLTAIYFQAIGLFTFAIGVSMAVKMNEVFIVVSSLAIGALLGEWWNLEKSAERMSTYLKNRFRIGNERFSDGLITAFLLFCVGSMTILGTIQEGMGESPDLLYTKSLIDFFSAILLASAFGIGVAISAIPLFIFQASLTLLARYAGDFFTDSIIIDLTGVGGILLMGLAINILEIKKLRIMNMLPSLIVVIVLLYLFNK